MYELLHFAVELFPQHKLAARSDKYETVPIQLVEILLFEEARNRDPFFDADDAIAGASWRDASLARFAEAAGRQLSGNHRLTAILLVDEAIDGCGPLTLNNMALALVQRVKEALAHATKTNSRIAFSPTGSDLATWKEFTRKLRPAFEARESVMESCAGAYYFTERHVLFATRADIASSNICIPPRQMAAFDSGDPIFLSPLRLFRDEALPRGAPALSPLETEGRTAFAIATYRLRHMLEGYHGAGGRIDWLHPAAGADRPDADQVMIALTGEHMMESNRSKFGNLSKAELRQKVGDEAGRTGPNALADLMRLAGTALRERAGIPKKRNILEDGRQIKALGASLFSRSENEARHVILAARDDLRVAALLNARGSLISAEVDRVNNSEGRFQKPISAESRLVFSREADLLLESLLARPTGNGLDRWTSMALNTGFNPVRFWPSAWPLFLHFEAAIGIGELNRRGAFDSLTNEQVVGIDALLNFDTTGDFDLVQSREVLRSMFPAEKRDDFNRAFSRVPNRDKLLLLDEKAKHDLAEFRQKQQEDRKDLS